MIADRFGLIRLTVTLVIALSAAHCSSYQNTATKLKDTAYRYNDAVRWRNFKAAAGFVDESIRKNYLAKRREQGQSFKVLDYEVMSVRQTEANKTAEIQVRFTWHQLPSNVVQKIQFKQTWVYGKSRKWWYLRQEEVKDKPKTNTKPVF